ncbi:sugar kinase [Pseudomaricurvus sp. HS19]|uniref:sugar kinase n=1 Tax=Pseudomaricurvus sp. HS19 TaxID=2692626 RepID=UPI00136D0EE5|nr:sugar kinase [Pseudomaricurvus sp. HS19]MYM62800.1 sugar kinase [Pseudomaricurvus sp. HS19]
MRILCAGEVMVEFASGGGAWQQAYGGDTYNTAIYMARAGMDVEYMTALGDDHFSAEILAALAREQVGSGLIPRLPGRQPGLYTIHNQPDGEREFRYWRGRSPARELFDEPVELVDVPDIFYFSGITLAVTRSGLDNLVQLIAGLRRRGCQIVFDPNYRPRLWSGVEEARSCYEAVLGHCDMVLPTLDDETQLWGIDSAEACRDFYRAQGVQELVIKVPGPACQVWMGDSSYFQPAEAVDAVDTTGAGDSFNAAYIASRASGESVATAVSRAQQLAAQVVMHRGAVLPR